MVSNANLHSEDWQTGAVTVIDAEPTPDIKRYARAKLKTQNDIANELARVYRLAKSGEMDSSIATRLTYILTSLSKIKSDAELEKRIEALERRGI